ncbi:MAG: hypothetical protein R2861_04400 [Desulfobacterales bacterium]
MLKKKIAILWCIWMLFLSPAVSQSETPTEDLLDLSLYELMNVRVTSPPPVFPRLKRRRP